VTVTCEVIVTFFCSRIDILVHLFYTGYTCEILHPNSHYHDQNPPLPQVLHARRAPMTQVRILSPWMGVCSSFIFPKACSPKRASSEYWAYCGSAERCCAPESAMRAQRFMVQNQTTMGKVSEALKDTPPEVNRSAPFVSYSFLAQGSFREAPCRRSPQGAGVAQHPERKRSATEQTPRSFKEIPP